MSGAVRALTGDVADSPGGDSAPARKPPKSRRTVDKFGTPLYRDVLLPLSFGLYRLVRLAIDRMSPAQVYLFARILGLIFWFISRKHRLIALRNLELAFGDHYSPMQRRHIARRSIQHFLCTVFDLILLQRLRESGNWCEVIRLTPTQQKIIEQLAEEPKPVAWHTAHLGSWELGAAIVGLMGGKLDFVYRPIEHPQLDAEVRALRTSFGNRVYSNDGALRGYMQTLREGGRLGVIADQNAGRRAAYLSFFGVAASTETSYFRLYQRYRPKVVALFLLRDGFEFRFHVEGVFETELRADADPLEEEMRLGQWYMNCVEQVARQYPEQYLWSHKRFVSRPKGVPSLYDGLGRALDPAVLAAQPRPPIAPKGRT